MTGWACHLCVLTTLWQGSLKRGVTPSLAQGSSLTLKSQKISLWSSESQATSNQIFWRRLSFCSPTQHFPALFSPNLTHVSTPLFLQQRNSTPVEGDFVRYSNKHTAIKRNGKDGRPMDVHWLLLLLKMITLQTVFSWITAAAFSLNTGPIPWIFLPKIIGK
jgi:hypothetical protein